MKQMYISKQKKWWLHLLMRTSVTSDRPEIWHQIARSWETSMLVRSHCNKSHRKITESELIDLLAESWDDIDPGPRSYWESVI